MTTSQPRLTQPKRAPTYRARRGVVMLEVIIALAFFGLVGGSLALALSKAAQLQRQNEAQSRLHLAIANARAELNARQQLTTGNHPLNSTDPAIQVQAYVQLPPPLSDQYGRDIQASTDPQNPANPTQQLVEVQLQASYQLDPNAPPLTEELSYWHATIINSPTASPNPTP